jgi:DNA polymerase III alpha subunit
MKRFEPHCHTEYSNIRLLDAINKPKDLIDRAIELGLAGIAITDHECLAGHIKANKYAKEIQKEHPDFKVALGNEIYLVNERENGVNYFHFILIAKDKEGHKQLRQLSSLAWLNSYYDRGMERVVTIYDDIKGIGKKTAERIVLELKGKFEDMRKELLTVFGNFEKGSFLGSVASGNLRTYLWKMSFSKEENGKKVLNEVVFFVRVFCAEGKAPAISTFGVKLL